MPNSSLTCSSCRFWSDHQARKIGPQISAICLSPLSRYEGRWKREDSFCLSFAPGEAIDLDWIEDPTYEEEQSDGG